ncbi:MAG: TetR family transcriptional regulator [Cellulomonas sp.]|uniref:acyl-CoA-like ligand-binding transcription factor n=1 Tax=Cellulomonas sp. 73-92 TaxID=1895740 RepID=UPI00092CC166|nr:TetR family transcriptional regulator [Cellulomonas sp. 73-92]MBN9373871.1 TetR family transcriptional regulator [Cellulomonas sp.]OJV76435.1 MAG: TetR family transcriptional regulator [Cellulomonas sp. 73-92]
MSEASDPQTTGLRERKKARTRQLIQEHGLRLFREQGYEATTVQQIIDAAEVSESTFFRYFPTKAEVVLVDDFDPILVSSFLAQPPGLTAIQALRASFRDTFGALSDDETAAMKERNELVVTVPELRAAMLDQLSSTMQVLGEAVAQRTGRPPNDPAVRTLVGAVVGVAVAVELVLFDDPTADLVALLDEAMGQLEAGLRL